MRKPLRQIVGEEDLVVACSLIDHDAATALHESDEVIPVLVVVQTDTHAVASVPVSAGFRRYNKKLERGRRAPVRCS